MSIAEWVAKLRKPTPPASPESIEYLKRGVDGWRDLALTYKAKLDKLEAQPRRYEERVKAYEAKVKLANANTSRLRKVLTERNKEIKRLKEQLVEANCADVIDEYIANNEVDDHVQ